MHFKPNYWWLFVVGLAVASFTLLDHAAEKSESPAGASAVQPSVEVAALRLFGDSPGRAEFLKSAL